MRGVVVRAAFAGCVLAAACSKSSAPAPREVPAASSSAPADAPPPAPPSAASEQPAASAPQAAPIVPPNPAPAGEARRTTVASLEADVTLRPYLAKLREHFGKDARGPFALQRVDLAEGRAAFLVARADESDPVVLAVDPVAGQLLFAKDRPVAGIAPPVVHATIAPAPERGVAVFAYVASMKILAARMWADDANPYADVEVFHPAACDELTVAYQAGFGWIAACASHTGTQAQRLRENLMGAWGEKGIPVGTNSPVGRAAITFEALTRWRLVQRAKAVGGDRQLTYRYDADGLPVP